MLLFLALLAFLCPSASPSAEQQEHAQQPARSSHFQSCWSQDSESILGRPPCGVHLRARSDQTAKVAFLFLAQDKIPTEAIWTAFFTSAAELALRRNIPPTRPLRHPMLPINFAEVFCSQNSPWDLAQLEHWEEDAEHVWWDKQSKAWLGDTCSSVMTGRQVYEQQELFSMYLHRSPGAPSFHDDSIFHGRDIEDRVFTRWGDISLVAALRNLLKAALSDERNSKFVLVSESCIPLRHPALVWAQHMAEAHLSRVGSHPADLLTPGLDVLLKEDLLEQGVLQQGQKLQLLKGSQWVSLTRMHAHIVATDNHLWPLFAKWCRKAGDCQHYNFNEVYGCVADERFVPTVLKFYNQSGTVNGDGRSTFVDWTPEGSMHGGPHPRMFRRGQSDLALSLMLESHAGEGLDGCYQEQLNSAPTAAALFNREASVCPNSQNESQLHTENIANATATIMDRISQLPAQLRAISAPEDQENERATHRSTQRMQAILERNLQQTEWLHPFQPMSYQCPLIGRKEQQRLERSRGRCLDACFLW